MSLACSSCHHLCTASASPLHPVQLTDLWSRRRRRRRPDALRHADSKLTRRPVGKAVAAGSAGCTSPRSRAGKEMQQILHLTDDSARSTQTRLGRWCGCSAARCNGSFDRCHTHKWLQIHQTYSMFIASMIPLLHGTLMQACRPFFSVQIRPGPLCVCLLSQFHSPFLSFSVSRSFIQSFLSFHRAALRLACGQQQQAQGVEQLPLSPRDSSRSAETIDTIAGSRAHRTCTSLSDVGWSRSSLIHVSSL